MMRLIHTALYAKLHYARSGNIWRDILKCIEADNYTPVYGIEDAVKEENYEEAQRILNNAKDSIITILVNNVTPIIKNDKSYLLNNFIESIDERESWKFGYFHQGFWGKRDWKKEEQDLLEPYDRKTAILYFFLSQLQGATIDELGWSRNEDERVQADRKVLPLRREVEDMKSRV